jgi:hypothetical protein
MLKTIRDVLLGVLAAIAGAFATVFGLTRYLDEEKPEAQPAPRAKVRRPEGQHTSDELEGAASEAVRTRTGDEPGKREADAGPLPPGWTLARPETLARPTYWPVVMAASITLVMWGIATTFLLSGIGLLLFALALAGWVGDLLSDGKAE